MSFLLEVIASTGQDAEAAEQGGADRIELCVSLDAGGLTPPIAVVQEVLRSVHIPVRVMICENPSYERPGVAELARLAEAMREITALGVDGVVIGFAERREVDLETLRRLARVSPLTKITFHRVFERLRDPIAALLQLKSIPQVDHILLSAAAWKSLTEAASPEIALIAGGGLRAADFSRLLRTTPIREFHTGRAVRTQQKADGRVEARLVRELREAITRD